MKILLSILFTLCCIVVLVRVLKNSEPVSIGFQGVFILLYGSFPVAYCTLPFLDRTIYF